MPLINKIDTGNQGKKQVKSSGNGGERESVRCTVRVRILILFYLEEKENNRRLHSSGCVQFLLNRIEVEDPSYPKEKQGFSMYILRPSLQIPLFIYVPGLGYVESVIAMPLIVVFLLALWMTVTMTMRRGGSGYMVALLVFLVSLFPMAIERLFASNCEWLLDNALDVNSGVSKVWLDAVREVGMGAGFDGVKTVENVIEERECIDIARTVMENQKEWMPYGENYFLPEFRFGGFPINDDNNDCSLSDVTSERIRELFEDEMGLFSKIASAFEKLHADEGYRVVRNNAVGYPGFQIQYSNKFYEGKVFTKHVDWVGLDFVVSERLKQANGDVVSVDGPLIAGVLPIALPSSGGGLDWFKYDNEQEDCLDTKISNEVFKKCIKEEGKTDYVVGDMYFYRFPLLHALSPWKYVHRDEVRIVVVAFFSHIANGSFLLHPHPLRLSSSDYEKVFVAREQQ